MTGTRTPTRRTDRLTGADNFSGIGGGTKGMVDAGVDVIAAANHWDYAIDVHSANHPDIDHYLADLLDHEAASYVHPRDLPGANIMWWSPSCRFHTPANATKLYRGTQPSLFDVDDPDSDERYIKSERSRTTMVCPYLHAQRHLPDVVIVENVVEVTRWGPDRDGSQFKDWLNRWTKLGYEYEICYLNAMFFGCPQSRDRVFIVLWRKGHPAPNLDYRPPATCNSDRCNGARTHGVQAFKPAKANWPFPTWGKYRNQYIYRCQDCNQPVEPDTVGAHTIIDWSDLGPTIGERERPLNANTIARVKRGLEAMAGFPLAVLRNGKLGGMYTLAELAETEGDLYRSIITAAAGNTYERQGSTCRSRNVDQQLWAQTGTLEHAMVAQPLTIEMKGGGSKTSGQKSVADPMGTITGGGLNKALAVPMFAKFNGGPKDTAWHPTTNPIGTVTGRDTTGLVSATLPLVHGNSGDRTRHITNPLAALTGSRERYMMNLHAGTIDVEDCHFRMLKPATELAPAQGFGPDYILFGTQANIMQGVGNAVPPAMAQWLTNRAVKTFDTPTARANT